MGFQNRDYARRDNSGSWNSMEDAPVCRGLIVATVVVFLLQIFSTRSASQENRRDILQPLRDAVEELDPGSGDELDAEIDMPRWSRVSLVQKWLQLETNKVLQGQIWRLITCAFCHDRYTIWHIFVNMLIFWWFGPILESMYGSREFLIFYFTSALASSLAYVGLDLLTGDPVPAIGASGAVMAVTMLYAYHFPTQIIRVFFVIPVEIRYLVWIYAIYDLHPVLLELSGDSMSDGVAHAAHLGGMAFGYFYSRRHWRLSPLLNRDWYRIRRSKPVEPRDVIPFPRRTAAPPTSTSRLDEILDRIRESGKDSLTDDELQTLIQESERLRQNRQSGST
jgi:membrane associated rhomboid family serine protease